MRSSHPTAPAAELPVWLFENRGPTRRFVSRLALAQWLGRSNLYGHDLAPALRSVRLGSTVFGALVVEHRWTARQGDATLTAGELLALLPRPVSRWHRQDDLQAAGHQHRRSSVPGIHSHHGGYGNMLRSPRTLQLLREARFIEEENVPPVRARLRRHPTRWDDRVRGNSEVRNWKHYRSSQWRAAE